MYFLYYYATFLRVTYDARVSHQIIESYCIYFSQEFVI